MKDQVYVGIDGGGTRTRCIIAGSEFRVLGKAEAGPSNPLRTGIRAATREISRSISLAAREAGVAKGGIQAACAGLAGMRRGDLKEVLARRLAREAGPARFIVETDALIAFTAAIPGGQGVIAISGTGSVAFGMRGPEVSAYAGGLGPLLGDEGSAYWIGHEGLRCAARELDGRGSATGLAGSLLPALGAKDLRALSQLAAEGSLDVARIASLAPTVMQAARAGNSEAGRIVREAATHLEATVRSVAEKLGLTGETFTVALSGGLLQGESLLAAGLRDVIHSTMPRARVAEPFLPPEYGAAAIAMSAGGLGGVEECLLRLKEKMPCSA